LAKGLKGSYIVVHQRGAFFFGKEIELSEKATVINIPMSELTPGLYVATLFYAQK